MYKKTFFSAILMRIPWVANNPPSPVLHVHGCQGPFAILLNSELNPGLKEEKIPFQRMMIPAESH